MSFLDGLGVTISQKSNEVAAKTRDMVDITSMNGQIAKINKNVTVLYQQLGEKFYLANKDKEDTKFELELSEIRSAFSEIDELNEKIIKMKSASASEAQTNASVIFCKKCGAKNASDSVFCMTCGEKIG